MMVNTPLNLTVACQVTAHLKETLQQTRQICIDFIVFHEISIMQGVCSVVQKCIAHILT